MQNNNKSQIDWIDVLKAFAIIGILWNHTVELFGSGPWFSNPSQDWPEFYIRMQTLFPTGNSIIIQIVKFIGWLGDMGPGVFIFASGFTLVLSSLRKELSPGAFYLKRFERIFPTYILIHLIVNVFLVVVKMEMPGTIISSQNILSLLGFRFIDGLFLYLNPSWWFIGLIIQLYVLYPFLYRYLIKSPWRFVILTLIFTIFSRLLGILDLTYSKHMYSWMTGLFFGTRLFEFTFGMYFAYLFLKTDSWIHILLAKPKKVLLVSLLIYGIGFISSWTYLGSLISNIFITIGLSGIFYSIYTFINNYKQILKFTQYIGKNSFTIFLIHQPFLIYIASHYKGSIMYILLLLAILLAFVLSSIIEKFANHIYQFFLKVVHVVENFDKKLLSLSFWSSFGLVIIGCILIPVPEGGIDSIFFRLFFSAFVLYSCFYFYYNFKSNHNIRYALCIVLIISIITFVMPFYCLPYYSFAILISLSAYFLSGIFIQKKIAILISLLLLLIISISIEFYLRVNRPVEVDKWGEYPALQTDMVTIYSLIPDRTTHLKYNHYDYTLKTNRMGFASPEVDLAKKDTNTIRIYLMGDAFTMPEAINFESSYPALLQKKLQEILPQKNIEVINGGVTGYGPNEMLAQFQKYIDIIKPDIVINEFFVNEFEEINLSAEVRQYRIGFKFQTKVNKYLPIQLSGYLEHLFRGAINISNSDVSLLYFYEKNSDFFSDSEIAKFQNYFKTINIYRDKYKFQYFLMYVPSKIEVSMPEFVANNPKMTYLSDTMRFDFQKPSNILKNVCLENKVEFWNTKEFLNKNPIQPLYFETSWHWNKEGHQEIAKYIVKKITEKISIIDSHHYGQKN